MPDAASVKVYSQAPIAALRALVRRFLVVEFPAELSDWHLPETGLTAAFRFRGECIVNGRPMRSPAVLSGLTDRLRTHQHSRDNAQLVIHFTPAGGAALTRQPLDELWNRSEDLGDVLGHSAPVARLVDRLAHAANHARRVAMAEEFLLSCLVRSDPDPLVHAAVRWIQQTPGPVRMGKLVEHIGLSQSALERRFRRQVGTSPKRFALLHRLTEAARLCRSGISLAAAAHATGYYDQSHFTHAFRRVTGKSPAVYFAQTTPV